jgi:hypothetical protein
MTIDQFTKKAEELLSECIEELDKKARDYQSGYPDALDNIFEEAKELNMRPSFLIGIHANKHWHAIKRWLRDTHLDSESIWSRLRDVINYMVILQMVIERENYTASLSSSKPSPKTIEEDKETSMFYRPTHVTPIAKVPHEFQGNGVMCTACNLARGSKYHCVEVRGPGIEPGPGGLNVAKEKSND